MSAPNRVSLLVSLARLQCRLLFILVQAVAISDTRTHPPLLLHSPLPQPARRTDRPTVGGVRGCRRGLHMHECHLQRAVWRAQRRAAAQSCPRGAEGRGTERTARGQRSAFTVVHATVTAPPHSHSQGERAATHSLQSALHTPTRLTAGWLSARGAEGKKKSSANGRRARRRDFLKVSKQRLHLKNWRASTTKISKI